MGITQAAHGDPANLAFEFCLSPKAILGQECAWDLCAGSSEEESSTACHTVLSGEDWEIIQGLTSFFLLQCCHGNIFSSFQQIWAVSEEQGMSLQKLEGRGCKDDCDMVAIALKATKQIQEQRDSPEVR